MIKKLPFLLVIVTILFSCEAESFEESDFTTENTTENTPEATPAINQEKIIDLYNENDRGLGN